MWFKEQATYFLRAYERVTHGTSAKASTPTGRWGGYTHGFTKQALTSADAVLELIWESVNVTVPEKTVTPPPCKHPNAHEPQLR